MFSLPPYASHLERVWRAALVVICALILLFLIAPILVIMPLSFNSEPYFTYPMPGLSMKWYADFFQDPRWLNALKASTIIGLASTTLDRKSTRLNSSHRYISRMPSSA
jgi:putative spermidine/putrescine transport system permease protein